MAVNARYFSLPITTSSSVQTVDSQFVNFVTGVFVRMTCKTRFSAKYTSPFLLFNGSFS